MAWGWAAEELDEAAKAGVAVSVGKAAAAVGWEEGETDWDWVAAVWAEEG